MKKSAIIPVLCFALLAAGCGRVDSVETDFKPLEIEGNTNSSPEYSEEPTFSEDTPESEDEERSSSTTTATLPQASLVKRSTVSGVTKVTVPARTTKANAIANGGVRRTTTTTAGSTSSTEATTTSFSTDNPDSPVVTVRENYKGVMKDTSIEILRDGTLLQTIDINNTEVMDYYTKEEVIDSQKIVFNDFDFDGHYDIFIPCKIDELNTKGIFLRYDEETDHFVEWDAMKDIENYAWTDDMDGRLSTSVKKNELEFSTMTYEWSEEGELVLVSAERQYRLSDSAEDKYNVYIDYFTFTNGVDTLVKREKLTFDTNGNPTGTEEVEIEWTMRW